LRSAREGRGRPGLSHARKRGENGGIGLITSFQTAKTGHRGYVSSRVGRLLRFTCELSLKENLPAKVSSLGRFDLCLCELLGGQIDHDALHLGLSPPPPRRGPHRKQGRRPPRHPVWHRNVTPPAAGGTKRGRGQRFWHHPLSVLPKAFSFPMVIKKWRRLFASDRNGLKPTHALIRNETTSSRHRRCVFLCRPRTRDGVGR